MINAIIYLRKDLNDLIDAEKAKKKSDQPYSAALEDFIRAKDTVGYHTSYEWSKYLKKVNKKGKKNTTAKDFVLESIYVEEEEFIAKFGPLTTNEDMYVIACWYDDDNNQCGTQHGMTRVFDAEGNFSYTGVPTFPLDFIVVTSPVNQTALEIYLECSNDIGEETAAQYHARTGIVPLNEIGANQMQYGRDMTIYVV